MTKNIGLYAFVIVLVVTILIYSSGLSGPFTFDDEANITNNIHIQLNVASIEKLSTAAFSYGTWPFKRPLSMLSIGLNHYFSGLEPFGYKLVNLLIHLSNGLLLFFLLFQLSATPRVSEKTGTKPNAAAWTALLVCAAWLLHPINVTSVLYVIQRMTSLAAFFSLAGMLLYVWGRLKMTRGERGGITLCALGLFGATPLAFLSKETGILLPVYLLLIEWIFFGFGSESRSANRLVSVFFALTVALPIALVLYYFAIHPEWFANAYAKRPFTMAERLLTEPRVIWLYLKLLIAPRSSELSLFHDDIPLSTGWFLPITTVPAILGLAGLAITAILIRTRWPLAAFGLLFFLAGHLLESSIFALEIAHEHRNYLPGIGILLVLFSTLVIWRPKYLRVHLGIPVATILLLLFSSQTALRAGAWTNVYQLASAGVTDHPNSPRWQHEMGNALWRVREATSDEKEKAILHREARQHFLQAAGLSDFHRPGSLLAVLQIDSVAGKPTDRMVVSALREELPSGPVSPVTVTSLVRLFECHTETFCTEPLLEIEALLDALSSNPKLNPKNRGQLYAAAANYAANKVGMERALNYTQAAVQAYPVDLQHHLNHAMVLAYLGRTEEALNTLNRVRQKDTRGAYTSKLETIQAVARQSTGHPDGKE